MHHSLHLWSGIILFIFGATVLMERFELVPAGTSGIVWPIILVVVGVKLMTMEPCDHKKEASAPKKNKKKKKS